MRTKRRAFYPKGTIATIVFTLEFEVSMGYAFKLLGCPF